MKVYNNDNELVLIPSFIRVINSRHFLDDKSKLSIPFGKNEKRQDIIKDLTKLGNTLVFGNCGCGDSLFFNNIAIALKRKYQNKYMEMTILNPFEKMELSQFENANETYKTESYFADNIVLGLNNLIKEIKDRQNLLKKFNVHNIEEFNEIDSVKTGKIKPMSFRVVLIYDYFNRLKREHKEEFYCFISNIGKVSKNCGFYLVSLLGRTKRLNKNIVKHFDTQVIFRLYENPKWSYDKQSVCLDLIGFGDMVICTKLGETTRCIGYYSKTSVCNKLLEKKALN